MIKKDLGNLCKFLVLDDICNNVEDLQKSRKKYLPPKHMERSCLDKGFYNLFQNATDYFEWRHNNINDRNYFQDGKLRKDRVLVKLFKGEWSAFVYDFNDINLYHLSEPFVQNLLTSRNVKLTEVLDLHDYSNTENLFMRNIENNRRNNKYKRPDSTWTKSFPIGVFSVEEYMPGYKSSAKDHAFNDIKIPEILLDRIALTKKIKN